MATRRSDGSRLENGPRNLEMSLNHQSLAHNFKKQELEDVQISELGRFWRQIHHDDGCRFFWSGAISIMRKGQLSRLTMLRNRLDRHIPPSSKISVESSRIYRYYVAVKGRYGVWDWPHVQDAGAGCLRSMKAEWAWIYTTHGLQSVFDWLHS